MNETQIKIALQKFFKENRIVLWYDDNAEFCDLIASIKIDDVEIINLADVAPLQARVMFDVDNKNTKFLLYAPWSKPNYDEDWFLDVYKYAPVFKTDSATLTMNELGLSDRPELFEYFTQRKKFFSEKNRVARFKAIMPTHATDVFALDMAILTVETKAQPDNVFSIVISLLGSWVVNGTCDFDTNSEMWTNIEKHQMADSFWKLADSVFGYKAEKPSVKDFMLKLFATDVLRNLRSVKKPKAISAMLLDKQDNAYLCLDQWRDSASMRDQYDAVAKYAEEIMGVKAWDVTSDPKAWLRVFTFQAIETSLLSYLVDEVIETSAALDTDFFTQFIKERQQGYWANANKPERKYYDMYNVIANACNVVALINANGDTIKNCKDLTSLHSAYTTELYKIDLNYRWAINGIKKVGGNSKLVNKMLHFVESFYGTKYIDILAIRTNDIMTYAVAQNWKIPNIARQSEFFDRYISPIVNKDEKVFVIISDGMRYEIADELARNINAKNRLIAKMDSMLGVLPSYTALGMAALLPHKTLSYNENNDVLVDNKPTSGIDGRARILAAVKGTAISFDDFRKMNRDDGREFIRQYNVIYIYHNQIDATGDAQKTEEQVFSATDTSIREISDAIVYMANNLNATKIFVTADHGFMFQYYAPNATDHNKIEKPIDSGIFKKRYAFGKDMAPLANSISGTTEITAKTAAEGSVNFSVPFGCSLYNFIGGTRFIHGGAMPQEIIVPLIQVRLNARGKGKELSRAQPVKVIFMNPPERMTNKIQRFQLIQTEAVTEKNLQSELKIAIYEDETMNKPITNIKNLIFNSTSNDMSERKQFADLTLISGKSYDKKQDYFLRITDVNGIIQEQHNIKIDLVYDDEF